jgi:hypothetical protein
VQPPPAPYPEPPPYQQPPYDGYGQPYGYGRPPPPPVVKPPKKCCLWSLRYDPFDLILRRVTLEAEVAWGDLPFSIELAPSYIFDSVIEEIKEEGFDIAGRITWYIQGDPLKGFWLKAHFNFEYFQATLYNEVEEDQFVGTPHTEHCDSDSEPGTCSRNVNTAVLGLMLGSSFVFPNTGGFALTGGIGLGGAMADEKRLEVIGTNEVPGRFYVYYDEFGKRLKLLGTLSLGVTF